MAFYIQSRKIGKKKWYTHIPSYLYDYFAETDIQHWKEKNEKNKNREYRIIEVKRF